MRSGRRRWGSSLSNYEVLIFDWDGTLVDSIGRIVESIDMAADICGLPRRDEARVKGIIGLAMPEAVASLYPDLTDPKVVEVFRRAYGEHYLTLETEPSALYPGVARTLQMFRDRGHVLAVATGKGRAGLDRALAAQGWEDFFDITRCADETASKPDPLMLHEILAHCGVRSTRALMVGDSVFDLQMASRAGLDSVAVTYGAQPAEILLACSPRLAVNEFSEVGDWLNSVSIAEVENYVG